METSIAISMLQQFGGLLAERLVQQEEAASPKPDTSRSWRWAEGAYVFPEGLCPYCGAIMQSPCIWLVDGLNFLGSWKVTANGFVKSDVHPHVSDGSICMGRSQRVGDALFLGINPLSMYTTSLPAVPGETDRNTAEVRLKAWLADRFDHVCGQDKRTALEGVNITHSIAPEKGCGCGYCRQHRSEVLCPLCKQWYREGRSHGDVYCNYCERNFCREHKHVKCVDCGESYNLNNPTEAAYTSPCEDCERHVCNYCSGVAPGSERTHNCSEYEDEETGVTCDNCDARLHCANCLSEHVCD